MDEELSEQNLSTLKEMILDEEKLVTYLSLSKDLCIHVNSSKSLLKLFVERILKKRPVTKLNIKFIISGLTEGGRARTMICSEDELTKSKSELNIIFFEHIYSVCFGKARVDEAALSLVNKFEDISLCKGLIKNIQCERRSYEEMGALKTISQEIITQTTSKPQAPKSFFGNKKPKEEKKESSIATAHKQSSISNEQSSSNKSSKLNGTATKTEQTIKSEPEFPKKNSTSIKPISPKGNLSLAKQKSESKSQKGIAGFFSKQKSKEAEDIKKASNKDVEVQKEAVQEEQMDVDVEERIPDQKTKGHKNGTEPKAKSKSTANNKLSQIKKTAKVDKKRKRVLHVSDSESEGEKDDPFSDNDDPVIDTIESDDEIPPTPNVSMVKITSGIVNPKKKRKIVDKTYTDEEGYILTKKVEVYESCSDHEDEGDSKENVANTVVVKRESSKEIKAPAKNSRKKVSPPQKGKQATLMNFFQKK